METGGGEEFIDLGSIVGADLDGKIIEDREELDQWTKGYG